MSIRKADPGVNGRRLRKADIESATERPKALKVNPDGIPADLKDRPQWVCWTFERREDGKGKRKWTKVPIDPKTGGRAKANAPDTWASFEEALAYYWKHECAGVGFEFAADDPYCGIDLDDCRDSETRTLDLWAEELVTRFGSYTDISPSRTGVKVFVRGKKPDGGNRKGAVEIYDQGRFFCVTGKRHEGTPDRIASKQKTLRRFHTELFAPPPPPATIPFPSSNGDGQPHDLGDDEIIDKAKAAKNGAKFARLWAGDITGYDSHSEADLALCSMLAFWTGPDGGRIDKLFRQSGLMRPKWDRYGASQIEKALAGKTQFYAPRPDEPGETGGRPTIVISVEEQEVNGEAIKALTRDLDIYQHGGRLVRIVRDKSPATEGVRRPFGTRIDELHRPLLRERLAANARWLKPTRDGLQPEHPPDWCVSNVHARGEWDGIRHLEAITDSPVLKPNGTLLDTPGYDAETALCFDPVDAVPEIPDKPTKDHAVAARKALLGVVGNFPFAARQYKAAWLAGLLTPLARFAFTGPAPLFLVDSNVRGAGKGLLLNCIAFMVTGSEFPTSSYTNDEEEFRKRITSLAMKGDRLVLFDNLVGRFGNAVLDAALTTTCWEDRVLGGNRIFRGPLYATFFATGNNTNVGADTSRRICHVRLESPLENPETRTDFRHPHLLAWVKSERKRLLGAALTILRAYCVADKPDMDLPAWGSFEGWSSLVRNAVVWCGLPDPGETRVRLQETADDAAANMSQLLRCWEELDPDREGATVANVIATICGEATSLRPPSWQVGMKSAVEALTDCNDPRQLPRLLGYKLRDYQRRIFDGRFLDKIGTTKNAVKWAVMPAEEFRNSGG